MVGKWCCISHESEFSQQDPFRVVFIECRRLAVEGSQISVKSGKKVSRYACTFGTVAPARPEELSG